MPNTLTSERASEIRREALARLTPDELAERMRHVRAGRQRGDAERRRKRYGQLALIADPTLADRPADLEAAVVRLAAQVSPDALSRALSGAPRP